MFHWRGAQMVQHLDLHKVFLITGTHIQKFEIHTTVIFEAGKASHTHVSTPVIMIDRAAIYIEIKKSKNRRIKAKIGQVIAC